MINKLLSPYELGKLGEEFALKYFKKSKYEIVETGYRLYRGEIDIIAYDKNTLVFIEVKTRQDLIFGPPEEAVTPKKQAQIRKIAEAYLAKQQLDEIPCRFDVLALLYDTDTGFQFKHFRDAF